MLEINRRGALGALTVSGAGISCSRRVAEPVLGSERSERQPTQLGARVVARFALPHGSPWPTFDPFLFCVHHNDRYPQGNGRFGPSAALDGRELGRDFAWKDGWNMYHGLKVPGFPRHPHRGFETVTVVRQGRLDHADSLGALARYGDGDVQWLTAGAGIQHAEMFPLLQQTRENPIDLFQIWLNLPRSRKFAAPHFSMFWSERIPSRSLQDEAGHVVRLTVRAGILDGLTAPSAPPDSWASHPENDVVIATLELEPGARYRLPAALPHVSRALYLTSGSGVSIAGTLLVASQGVQLDSHLSAMIEAGAERVELLLLQARPIGEPVARRGPFVMNSDQELRQAAADFQRTEFGGWPWPDAAPVHGADPARFTQGTGGKIERPT